MKHDASKNAKIHPTAIVSPEAEIHPSCEIGPFCVIDRGVRLGPDNRLMSHVAMQGNTTVGTGNIFFPFSVIGAIPQDLKYQGEDTKLVIGDHNTFRECVTLNIGTAGGGGVTRIGDHNLLMAYVHIAHDVVIGHHTILGNSCQVAGHVLIEDYATVGGLSAIGQYIRVGTHAYIGGASGLDRDVPRFTLGRGISQDYEVWGINRVGLKRRGFSDTAIAALQEVSKMFFKDKSMEKEATLQKIEQTVGHVPEVQRFVEFIRETQKGIYR